METVLDASVSVLIAQVREADASHKIDTAHQLLRGRHFNGPSNVVYLGDVAKALLSQLPHPETPEFLEPPGYNEQQWVLTTSSGDLRVNIASRSYWGWGLFTSGYLNVITLEGPLASRARLVLDITSSLGQSPWEMAHLRGAQRWLNRHHSDLTLKDNERSWRALFEAGRDALNEAIEAMRARCEDELEHRGEDIDHATWQALFDEDLHMAQRALAEDNAPGVERALARLEAGLIQLNTNAEAAVVPAPLDRFSDGSDVFAPVEQNLDSVPSAMVIMAETDEVPFVDLSTEGSVDQEE
jgi:hypothetical protein